MLEMFRQKATKKIWQTYVHLVYIADYSVTFHFFLKCWIRKFSNYIFKKIRYIISLELQSKSIFRPARVPRSRPRSKAAKR